MTRHLHRLDPSTHTVELDQLHAIDAALAAHAVSDAAPAISAQSLGLPGAGRLVSISYDGPPEYPYVSGHFAGAGSGDTVVEFHTEALQALAHALHLNQRWGL